jgi:hypothetical protein
MDLVDPMLKSRQSLSNLQSGEGGGGNSNRHQPNLCFVDKDDELSIVRYGTV